MYIIHCPGDLDMVSNQVFLMTPSVLLIIHISLLRVMNNYANPKVFLLLLTWGMLGLLSVIIIEVLLRYFHSMA